jgi:hypothetical protein
MIRVVITSTLRAMFVGTSGSLLVACAGGGGPAAGNPPPDSAPPPAANHAPSIVVASSFEVLAGRVLTITPSASDPDGDALTFSASSRPAWLSFSSRTGVLTGTPGAADVGIYDPIITVSDGKAQASDQARVTVVQAAAGRATLSWQAPTQRVDGSPLSNLAGFRVYYGNSAGDLRYVIQVADPGARSRVIEDLTVGIWFFAATAYDESGGESSRSSIASKRIA